MMEVGKGLGGETQLVFINICIKLLSLVSNIK